MDKNIRRFKSQSGNTMADSLAAIERDVQSRKHAKQPFDMRYLKLTEEPMKPSEEISDMTRQVKLRSSLIQAQVQSLQRSVTQALSQKGKDSLHDESHRTGDLAEDEDTGTVHLLAETAEQKMELVEKLLAKDPTAVEDIESALCDSFSAQASGASDAVHAAESLHSMVEFLNGGNDEVKQSISKSHQGQDTSMMAPFHSSFTPPRFFAAYLRKVQPFTLSHDNNNSDEEDDEQEYYCDNDEDDVDDKDVSGDDEKMKVQGSQSHGAEENCETLPAEEETLEAFAGEDQIDFAPARPFTANVESGDMLQSKEGREEVLNGLKGGLSRLPSEPEDFDDIFDSDGDSPNTFHPQQRSDIQRHHHQLQEHSTLRPLPQLKTQYQQHAVAVTMKKTEEFISTLTDAETSLLYHSAANDTNQFEAQQDEIIEQTSETSQAPPTLSISQENLKPVTKTAKKRVTAKKAPAPALMTWGRFTVEDAAQYSRELKTRASQQQHTAKRQFKLKSPTDLLVPGAPSCPADALVLLRQGTSISSKQLNRGTSNLGSQQGGSRFHLGSLSALVADPPRIPSSAATVSSCLAHLRATPTSTTRSKSKSLPKSKGSLSSGEPADEDNETTFFNHDDDRDLIQPDLNGEEHGNITKNARNPTDSIIRTSFCDFGVHGTSSFRKVSAWPSHALLKPSSHSLADTPIVSVAYIRRALLQHHVKPPTSCTIPVDSSLLSELDLTTSAHRELADPRLVFAALLTIAHHFNRTPAATEAPHSEAPYVMTLSADNAQEGCMHVDFATSI